MYRPQMPPQGMRPPGGPPSGPFSPSGLPPPQIPPAGYRPSFPGGNIPPPGISPGMTGSPNASFVKPPIQMMSNMSLDSSNSQQFLSNGIPNMINTSHSPHSAINGTQAIDSVSSQMSSVMNNTEMPSTLDSMKSLPRDVFPNAQGSIQDSVTDNSSVATMGLTSTANSHRSDGSFSRFPNATPSPDPSFNSMGISSQSKSETFPSNLISTMHQPEVSSSPHTFNSQTGGMQYLRQEASPQSPFDETFNNVTQESVQRSLTDHSIHTGLPSSVSMGQSSFSGMPPVSSNMAPSRIGLPPLNSPVGGPPPLNPGISPISSPMGGPLPLNPGIPPISSPMGGPLPLNPGIPPISSPMVGPPRGMPSISSPLGGQPRPGMPPPTYSGMPPVSSQIELPKFGVPPVSSQMGPPKLGMPTMNSQMGPPRPGMPPLNSMGPKPGMPPLNSMGPPKPGMFPSDPQGGSPRFGLPPPPPGSNMISPKSDLHAQKPGIPPPPPSGSYVSGPGLPPQQASGQMGPGLHPGMQSAPGPMGQVPAPGMGGMQNRYPGTNSAASSPMGGYPQGSQGRRLNPDDMPSPLQVIDEDRQCRSGEFITNIKGALPPLVTTEFVVKDGGNASPRFLRSTMYSVPATQDMMKQSCVPFGLVISPLAELYPEEAPIYMGTSLANGPVRCNRCKGYMSPLMMFMDGGRRFQCLLCKQINEVPADYYCHMDSQGARADKFQRPELCLGTYEFAATAEYCKDKLLPKEPAFIFVLEMSQMMIQRGIVNLLCQNMKSILQHLPKDHIPGQEVTKSSIRVGFITYDSSVHFYKLTGLAPEMCIVCDKENMFVPVPDGVLCDVDEVADNIDKLMECIPQNFLASKETSGALSCAIQAGMAALKASGRTGKLFVFHSSLPQIEGPGKLKNREERKLLGTDKEKIVLTSQNTHYNNLAQDLVTAGCGVDFYIFNEGYVDLATIGQVSRLTGGQCFKYTFFQPNKDAERLFDDLKQNISRDIAFDAVMRVRTSTGVRPVEFFGHFFMSNTQDVELSVVDSSKAIVVEVKHDDKITEEDGVYIQVALLYTSMGGQRKLRILNIAFNICTQMADLYKNCDLDTLMNFFGKQSVFKFLETSAKQVKENLVARTAQILACYRKNCASPSSAGQLILPELMKLLPLYINCLAKCDALSGGHDLTCDDRSWHIYQLSTMNVDASVVYFYPRLVPLTDIDPQENDIPQSVRTSYEKLSPDGAYLLENGLFMFMWVGSGISQGWMKDVFGVAAPHQLDPVLSELPESDNPTSRQVRGVIQSVRKQRRHHVRLYVVPQQGKHEVVMRNYLIEDKGVYGAPSYVDFLCHVHKEIRALLS